MSRENRASQFMPFDALKGLSEALKLVEYEHYRVTKGEISDELANKISATLATIKKDDLCLITYFQNGHIQKIISNIKLDLTNKILAFNRQKILLSDLLDIDILN